VPAKPRKRGLKVPPPFDIILEAIKGWSRDNVPRLGASLAYYTLFSIAPVLLICVTVAGQVFGQEAVRGQLSNEIEGVMGRDGAQAVQSLLEGAVLHGGSTLALIVGLVAFFGAATGAFLELQHALNTIFQVKTDPQSSITALLKRRVLSFGLAITMGFLLVVSLAVSAALSAVSTLLHAESAAMIWQAVDMLLSVGSITLLFALIYWFLPDVKLRWPDVWTGAFVTAVLFSIGKYLIGLYLGQTSIASSYGAVGSILVLLVWVYYSAQIILLGAEITRVYAERRRHGHKPVPEEVAKPDPGAHPSVS
jgi:membrane protein